MKKIVRILLIVLLFITVYSNVSFAGSITTDDIWAVGKEFIDLGVQQNGGDTDVNAVTKSRFEFLIDFLWGLGLLIIFISTIALGIKYMLVLPEERSRIKQATTPYVVGVVIIFGAITIWKFLINILDGSL